MYENYISVSVKNDMQDLANAIVDSQNIYVNILDEEVITKGDAYLMAHNSGILMELYQKYNGMAKRFGHIENRTTQNTTAGVAQEISAFFSGMIRKENIDSSNLDDVQIKLNGDMKQKVIKLKELNSIWLSSVKNNVFGVMDKQGDLVFNTQQFRAHYGENILSNNFWVNLVVDIDSDTQKYLHDNSVFEIENVLFN